MLVLHAFMPKTELEIGNRNRSSCFGTGIGSSQRHYDRQGQRGVDKRRVAGTGCLLSVAVQIGATNNNNNSSRRRRDGTGVEGMSLVELWLKELTDKIKYAL